MYGFVYIWYDRKHKRFYIGSHWGTEDDGYTTGQAWSRNAIKRRPQDFRRRILWRNIPRDELIWHERYWLWYITPEELGKRYYNLNREPMKHWHTDERSRMSVSEKRRAAQIKLWQDPKYREHMSEAHKGQVHSKETTEKRLATMKRNGTKTGVSSEQMKELWASGKFIGTKGMKFPQRSAKMKGKQWGKPFSKGQTPWNKKI